LNCIACSLSVLLALFGNAFLLVRFPELQCRALALMLAFTFWLARLFAYACFVAA
jgi:hypothetical protein